MINGRKVKVREAIYDVDEKDYKKKLELLKLKEEIAEEIKYAKEQLEKKERELNTFLDCDFNKIELVGYGFYGSYRTWKCGKLQGEPRRF